MGHTNWSTLIRQIRKHRSEAAQFFKPVCVIAMIDLADEGRIEPAEIDAKLVCDRFSDYVSPFYPDRGKDGYKPLWHLTNDRLWTFFCNGKSLGSSDFSHGAPASKAKLLAKVDHLEIGKDYIDIWKSEAERKTLRLFMLAILNESDSDSRNLIPPLFNKINLLEKELWPSAEHLRTVFSNLTGQGDLFEAASVDASPSSSADRSSSFEPAHEIDAIDHVPTPIAYGWVANKIAVVENSANRPIFPFATSRRNHAPRLEACRVKSQDLILKLKEQVWQVRNDYKSELESYIRWLPTEDDPGNILLADGAARIIRYMFFAEREILPFAFAASLKILLEQHIALRAFYPEVEDFYRSVRSGHIDSPLPIDAVYDIIGVIDAQTPAIFDEGVSDAIKEASSPELLIAKVENDATDGHIAPPIDPLGELDPSKAHDFQTAGWVNNLWKIFNAGAAVYASVEPWIKTYQALIAPVTAVLKWLRDFLS